MARARRRLSRLESNINITPMGDVALCLLLGFLVITPILIDTLNANLPQAGGVSSGSLKQDPVVVLREDGTILLDDEAVTLADLGARIEALFPPGVTMDRKVAFTGSGAVQYQDVIDILDLLRAHGVETFGIR